jgi:hypothetical protein
MLYVAVATFGARWRAACGGTFSAELAFAPTPGEFGEYLTAPYDLGVAFAHVESVRLQLNLPRGFEGTAWTTGNSTFFRHLSMQIHDPAEPPPVEYLLQFLGHSAFAIPPSVPAEFEIGRFEINFGGVTTYTDWPAFLLTGRGNVSLIDVNTSNHHPLPSGEVISSTTTWRAPFEVEGGRLIIDAIPAPEPSAVGLALIALACCRRRK